MEAVNHKVIFCGTTHIMFKFHRLCILFCKGKPLQATWLIFGLASTRFPLIFVSFLYFIYLCMHYNVALYYLWKCVCGNKCELNWIEVIFKILLSHGYFCLIISCSCSCSLAGFEENIWKKLKYIKPDNYAVELGMVQVSKIQEYLWDQWET